MIPWLQQKENICLLRMCAAALRLLVAAAAAPIEMQGMTAGVFVFGIAFSGVRVLLIWTLRGVQR